MIRCALALALFSVSAFAAEKPFVRVRWNDSAMRIEYKGKTMTYDFGAAQGQDADKVKSKYRRLFLYQIDKVKTEYLEERNGVIYMISDIAGPSRGPQAATSMCGAGQEKAKAFFVFDKNGEIEEPSVILYESCFQSIGPADLDNEDPDNTHPNIFLKFEFIGYNGKVDVRDPNSNAQLITAFVTFDPEHPEKKWSVEESCIQYGPWQKSNMRLVCGP